MAHQEISAAVRLERMLRNFQELSAIDATSFHERAFADALKNKLEALGCTVEEDCAGDAYQSRTGNLYAYLKGSLPGAPLLFSAHMDTVEPGIGKKAVFHDDGTITSDGTTVLGSDDVSGIAQILEGIQSLQDAGIPHRDIELLFPIAEEAYIKGSSVFDYGKLRAKEAYVLDMSGAVGSAAIAAPTLLSFTVTITGRAAHAGFAPENGINAVAAAAMAIQQIAQGRLDWDTTLNIGLISGGTATNIVPEQCVCRGELRSYQHSKALQAVNHLKAVFEMAAKEYKAQASFDVTVHMKAYEIEKTEPVVQRFQTACRQLDLPGDLVSTFGGSDNHNFVAHGIRGIVLSCGMEKVHSTAEYSTTRELQRGAELVQQLILLP